MIGWLRGTVRRKALPAIVLDAGGVGYEVQVSLPTYERLPAEGAVAELEILTLVRSESLQLFGFHARREKELFALLLGVTGIGPRLAMSMLSALTPDDLLSALRGQDALALQRVPGIGRKSAERLIVELKDRLAAWPTGSTAAAPPAAGSTLVDDAVAALESLGYRAAEAERAVRDVVSPDNRADLAALLRAALRRLGERR